MENQVLDAVDGARATTMSENSIEVLRETTPQVDNSTTEMSLDTKDQDTTMEYTTMDEPEEAPLTHALEALLGGLEPVEPKEEDVAPTEDALPVQEIDSANVTSEVQAPETKVAPRKEIVPAATIIPGLSAHSGFNVTSKAQALEIEGAARQEIVPAATIIPGLSTLSGGIGGEFSMPIKDEAATESGPSAAVSADRVPEGNVGELSMPVTDDAANENGPSARLSAEQVPEGAEDVEGEEHPEWEIDSSPIESSSDDYSSDDSSDDESEDGDNTYKLLSPEEQARILMEGDGGSDDESGGKAKGVGGPLRTKNEVPEVVIPKPDVTITSDMRIEELGAVEIIVDNILLIKAKVSGEYRVLESGSVLCLEDRSVIGVVAETLGRVQQPLYSVMFTNATELKAAGLEVGTEVFYAEQHSTYVFTQALKAYKGSDASNLHDEEVGDEEVEFSDDEAEAEHRRRIKQMKLERKGGKAQQNGGGKRGGHPLQQQHQPYDPAQGISYDETEDDGPYKPLARPSGFANTVGRAEAPQEGAYTGQERPGPNRDHFRGRGRGDRGRGDRGRGRGDRGRGRGGFQDRRSDGHSLPPQPPQIFPPPSNGMPFPPFPQVPAATPNFFMPQISPQYSPHQPHLGWPQYPPQPPFQPPFQQSFQNVQNAWPNVSPPPQNGAFLNPAFFPTNPAASPPLWNQQTQQGGRGRGRGN